MTNIVTVVTSPVTHRHIVTQEPQGLVRRETSSEKENATLYHVFPHNQHLFQLPECASQQVRQDL